MNCRTHELGVFGLTNALISAMFIRARPRSQKMARHMRDRDDVSLYVNRAPRIQLSPTSVHECLHVYARSAAKPAVAFDNGVYRVVVFGDEVRLFFMPVDETRYEQLTVSTRDLDTAVVVGRQTRWHVGRCGYWIRIEFDVDFWAGASVPPPSVAEHTIWYQRWVATPLDFIESYLRWMLSWLVAFLATVFIAPFPILTLYLLSRTPDTSPTASIDEPRSDVTARSTDKCHAE